MYWLGIDFETTGLDPHTNRIIEVGAVLWDVPAKKPVRIINELVYDFGNDVPRLDDFIVNLTGINEDMLKDFGSDTNSALASLEEMADKAAYLVAHNAPFDKAFYEAECGRNGMKPIEKPWIDTHTDVDYKTEGSRSLTYLAADHGFLNPFAHRAVFDVLTMFQVIKDYDPEKIMAWQASPTVTLWAKTEYKDKDKAKNLSYRWNAEARRWLKSVKEFNLDEEITAAKEAGFDVELV